MERRTNSDLGGMRKAVIRILNLVGVYFAVALALVCIFADKGINPFEFLLITITTLAITGLIGRLTL